MSEFIKWPKTPHWDKVRLRITQKLDGTNAQILIKEINTVDLKPSELDLSYIEFLQGSGASGVSYIIYAGSRTRWLGVPNKNGKPDDNHGFHQWVMDNKEELIEKLGPGRYYGEWCGPGINNGENLTERGLFLFYPPKNCDKLPSGVHLVPELYNDVTKLPYIDVHMGRARDQLNYNGTYINLDLVKKNVKLNPPEGLIVQIDNQRYKWRFKLDK